jgi:hypothetical protein
MRKCIGMVSVCSLAAGLAGYLVVLGFEAAAQSVWPGSIVSGGSSDSWHDMCSSQDHPVPVPCGDRATGLGASAQVANWSYPPANWAQTAGASAQPQMITEHVAGSSGMVWGSPHQLTIVGSGVRDIPGLNAPRNALYHQVVDRYYDASGQEIETSSASHVIGYDCHPGRRQQDLIVEDDGKGGTPRFVALLMGNEPTEGQKPITAEDKVDVVAPASVPGSVTLAANR